MSHWQLHSELKGSEGAGGRGLAKGEEEEREGIRKGGREGKSGTGNPRAEAGVLWWHRVGRRDPGVDNRAKGHHWQGRQGVWRRQELGSGLTPGFQGDAHLDKRLGVRTLGPRM